MCAQSEEERRQNQCANNGGDGVTIAWQRIHVRNQVNHCHTGRIIQFGMFIINSREQSVCLSVCCVRSDGEPRGGETANGRVDSRVQGSAPPHACASPRDISPDIFTRAISKPPRY
jgi:hypothetical protein